MVFAWNPLGVFGLVVSLVQWSLAWLVYTGAPASAQARWLAAVLGAFALFLTTFSLLWFTTDPTVAWGIALSSHVAAFLYVGAYFGLLGTLDSPFARKLGRPAVRWGAAVVIVVVISAVLVAPQLSIAALLRVESIGLWRGESGPVARAWLLTLLGLLTTAVVVTLRSLRFAGGALARTKLKWYAAGFVTMDSLILVGAALFLVRSVLGGHSGTSFENFMFFGVVWPSAALLGASFLAYGTLKMHLFDVDLKIKFTIKQSTLVSIFVAVFFVVSEATALLIGNRTGSAISGIVAAGALLFVLAPLQRFADRVSDRAMPRVEDTPAYRARRGEEIYEAAYRGALADREVTEGERDMLAALQQELSLEPVRAREIERSIRASLGVS